MVKARRGTAPCMKVGGQLPLQPPPWFPHLCTQHTAHPVLFVILLSQWFVFQVVAQTVDGRQSCLVEFWSVGHVRVRIDALAKTSRGPKIFRGFDEIIFIALKQHQYQFFERLRQELVRVLRNAGCRFRGWLFFGVERNDLDVLIIYFTIFGLLFNILLLEILDDEVVIVIFQIVENYTKEILVATTMYPGWFQL